jgi:hypothetical protein
MTDKPHRSKPWVLRYSLRSLLILTALVAAFFGGRASMLPALQERERLLADQEAKARQAAATQATKAMVRVQVLDTFQSQRLSAVRREAVDAAERWNLFEHERRLQDAQQPFPADLPSRKLRRPER